MKSAIIMDIQRYSIHDGPGIRTTVFLKGCHMRCSWCHNPESQLIKPEIMFFEKNCIQCKECLSFCKKQAHTFSNNQHSMNVLKCIECSKKQECERICSTSSIRLCGKSMTVNEVMQEILRDKVHYGQVGGVTFSGGEPLLQIDFLCEIMKECRMHNIVIGLDTTLNVIWDLVEKVIPYVGFYLIDIKSMDEFKHLTLTGQSNQRLIENLVRLSNLETRIIIRMPLIAGVNDSEDELKQTRDFINSINKNRIIERVDVIPVSNHAVNKYRALGRDKGSR